MPSSLGQRVFINSGSIPLRDFAQFLRDFSRITVIVDPALWNKEVKVLADMQEADREVVRRLLFENGFALKNETLPDGRGVVVHQ